jgi:hypothetical protein
MVSNWILDISIGCLLLISLGYFYIKTEIFYGMFNWWIMIFLLPFFAINNLVEQSREKLNDAPELPVQTKYVEPIKSAEQYTLVQSIPIVIMWLIPILVDLIFGGVAIFTAHLLNLNLTLDDVYLICLTPAILLLITFLFKRFRETLSNINSSIYGDLGSIGIVANTFIVELGGCGIAKILGIAL